MAERSESHRPLPAPWHPSQFVKDRIAEGAADVEQAHLDQSSRRPAVRLLAGSPGVAGLYDLGFTVRRRGREQEPALVAAQPSQVAHLAFDTAAAGAGKVASDHRPRTLRAVRWTVSAVGGRSSLTHSTFVLAQVMHQLDGEVGSEQGRDLTRLPIDPTAAGTKRCVRIRAFHRIRSRRAGGSPRHAACAVFPALELRKKCGHHRPIGCPQPADAVVWTNSRTGDPCRRR